jgi:hypothetical protein
VCTSCVSSAEAVIINTTATLAFMRSAALRVGDRLAGRHPVLRQQEAWDLNAAFARSLGLDPAMVLPSRPVLPAFELGTVPVAAGLRA